MRNIFILVLSFCTVLGFSQKVQWEHSLGGKHSEYLFDMIPTADYGFLLAGSTLSDKSGDITQSKKGTLDAWLWKMKENGDAEWQFSLGGDGTDFLKSVNHTVDGGFILGISTTSGKSGDKTDESKGAQDVWIVKLNAARQIEWQKSFGGAGDDDVVVVKPTKDGGYIVGINTDSNVSGDQKEVLYGGMDVWLLRLDKGGRILWQKRYGGDYEDRLTSLIETQDKGILLGISSNSNLSGNKRSQRYGMRDFWVLKLDSQGKELWQDIYGGEGDDELTEVVELETKEILLVGTSNSEASGNKTVKLESESDFWTVRLKADGEVVTQQSYAEGEYNLLSNGLVTPKGKVLLGGFVLKNNKDGQNFSYIGVELDEEGEMTWEKELSSSGADVLRKVVQTRDGGYVFAGTSDGGYGKVKQSQKGRNDFWIVKVNKKDKEEEERVSIEAMPNPTSGFTNVIIGFEYRKGEMQLLDLNGRILQRREIEYQTEPVDLSDYPRGMYIVLVKTDQGEGSVKIIRK